MDPVPIQSTDLYTLQLPSVRESITVLENLIEEIADKYHVSDDIFANMMTCLNEAVTNAIKYAFTLGKKGKIIIGLDEPTRDSVELIISDNGPGLPENFDFSQSTSLGMSLMKGLCRQLNGELNFTSHNGLTLRLTIPTKVIIMEENYTAG